MSIDHLLGEGPVGWVLLHLLDVWSPELDHLIRWGMEHPFDQPILPSDNMTPFQIIHCNQIQFGLDDRSFVIIILLIGLINLKEILFQSKTFVQLVVVVIFHEKSLLQ